MLRIKVIEKATRNCHSMVPWHTLFADDLPISSEIEFHVIEKLNSWIKALQKCGSKINVATTKHLISGKKSLHSKIRKISIRLLFEMIQRQFNKLQFL